MSISRVGIVAKQGLIAASEHVARLGARLRERVSTSPGSPASVAASVSYTA